MNLGILAGFSGSLTRCVLCSDRATMNHWLGTTAYVNCNVAITRRHAGELPEYPRFGFFRIPGELSRRLSPECLSVTNKAVAGTYQTKLRLSWMTEMLIILVRARKCLFSCHGLCQQFGQIWKEIAGNIHTEGKEQAAQYFVHHTEAY
jgi:hypothetical protein